MDIEKQPIVEEIIQEPTIIDCLLKTYLVGSMEDPAAKDGGVGWRDKITPELQSRGIFIFNPTREEISKIGMPPAESIEKINGWIASGNREKFKQMMRNIWDGITYQKVDPETKQLELVHVLGDIDYVTQSKFLIFYFEEGDKLGGTIGEVFCAYEHNIPVYAVTKVPLYKFNKSVLSWIWNSDGEVFASFNQMFEYLDKKYHLKKKKLKRKD